MSEAPSGPPAGRGRRRTTAARALPAAVAAPAEPPPAVETQPSPAVAPPAAPPGGAAVGLAGGLGGALAAALAATLIVLVLAVVLAPFWAPAALRLLPWGERAATAPAAAASDPVLAALREATARNDAALQRLDQRLAALEARPAADLAPLERQVAALQARPPPDLGGIQQKLAALAASDQQLGDAVAALQKAAQTRPAADPDNLALALTLLQIRDAVDEARPFGAEYRTLVSLAHDRPALAAAAAPLADAADSGVASRVALSRRLRQLAAAIATAAPPPDSRWTSQLLARLRGLVTIRRIDGDGQTPAEAAVAGAERDLAGGDLAGAVAALSRLDGANAAAAEPWLQMARRRLAVEAALRQLAAALTATLGGSAPDAATPGTSMPGTSLPGKS